MPRYIDADKIPYRFYAGDELMVRKDVVDEQPTISPDDARGEGKWLDTPYAIECSKCHEEFDSEVACCDIYGWPWKFCPNCGAKMEVSEDA